MIVLGDVHTISGDVSGTFFQPPNGDVSTVSGSDRSVSRNLTWPRLYAKAVELGLIQK